MSYQQPQPQPQYNPAAQPQMAPQAQPQYNPAAQPQPQYQQPVAQPQYQAPAQAAPVYQAPAQQYAQAPAQQQYTQQYQQPQQQKAPSTVVEVTRSNYTTISLFEVSGGFDPGLKFPKSLCFVLAVPGVKDPSKASGRSYNMNGKINMKFSTQEIRSLGQSLINLSMWKQAVPAFEKHSDPSKNSFSQGQGEANTKKLMAKFDSGKNNIAITVNYGSLNVLIPVPLQDALGLGHDLINIGNIADLKLAEYKMAHRIGREEVEMPEHIQLEDAALQQMGSYAQQVAQQPVAQPQYAPAPAAQPQYQAPVAQPQQQYAPAPQGAPGYNPAAPQYAPAPQVAPVNPSGYPGA